MDECIDSTPSTETGPASVGSPSAVAIKEKAAPAPAPAAEFSSTPGNASVSDPMFLSAAERRSHILRNLLSDHASLLQENPEGAKAKFEKLGLSPFVFFRGTAGLFYRDIASSDRGLPKVLISGDVHPENFGVLAGKDGKLLFALNDYDEATMAPFSWDLKRGATGFALAARAKDLSPKDEDKVVKEFVRGYLEALEDFGKSGEEDDHAFTKDNTPKVVRKLLDDAESIRRKDFLSKRVDLDEGKFWTTDEVEPLTARVPEFQAALDAYVQRGQSHRGADFFKVKDVAAKKGSGTASVGLERYYVLIEGESKSRSDDIILELKEQRESVASSFVPQNPLQFRLQAARVVAAKNVQAQDANPFYGYAELGPKSFLVRERSPFKARVDLVELDKKELCDYAEVCGAALAQAHARADVDSGFDQAGSLKHAEKQILNAIEPEKFADDIVAFSDLMATRVELDFGMFKTMLESGELEPAPAQAPAARAR